jgi:hypothetical protein
MTFYCECTRCIYYARDHTATYIITYHRRLSWRGNVDTQRCSEITLREDWFPYFHAFFMVIQLWRRYVAVPPSPTTSVNCRNQLTKVVKLKGGPLCHYFGSKCASFSKGLGSVEACLTVLDSRPVFAESRARVDLWCCKLRHITL